MIVYSILGSILGSPCSGKLPYGIRKIYENLGFRDIYPDNGTYR